MKKQPVLITMITLLLFGTALLFSSTVAARPLEQSTFRTPTPNQDGQIIYIVQEGDTCTRIFILFNVPIDEIIALNDLGPDCELFPGQQLILALVDPVTPTAPGPAATSTPGPPTPTPFEGTAQICVSLFEDLDGNQRRASNERFLGGGVISVSNRIGTFSETRDTVGGDPAVVGLVCFDDLPEGEYNLSMGIPEGFNPTTSMNYTLTVSAGDTVVVDFGAQPSTQVVNGEVVAGGSRSPFLLTIGLFLLAGGAVLAFFFIRSQMES